jgi:tetratricopeptide (TPR) repeat protein
MELKIAGGSRPNYDLPADYGEVTYLDSRNGVSRWRGQGERAGQLLTLLPHPSQAWLERAQTLRQANWPVLAPLDEVRLSEQRGILCERLLEGTPWSELELTPSRSRELGAELCDALALLHQAGLCSGPLRPDQLLLDRGRRLRLQGLAAYDPATTPGHSVRDDLDSALALLALPEHELADLQVAESALELSRVLRGRNHLYEYAEPPFVGRQSAWRRLDEALLGQCHLLTVEGPAGAGKTRLLREWSRHSGARVLWAKAERQVAPSPFAMFMGPLQSLEKELAGRPDLVSILVHSLGVEIPLLNNLRGRRERTSGLEYGTLVMLGLTLAVFGKDRPTVLVLDDCQWADPLTLRFLQYWAEHGNAMLVVATFRGDEVEPQAELRQLPAEKITLAPLTAEQSEQLLLSCHPSASLTLRERAIKAAEGNPFSLLCLLRTGKSPGELSGELAANLPSELQAALELASVLGRQFSLATLQGCLGQPVDLEPALAQGLLRRGGPQPVFAHDRVRDLVLARLHPDRLRALHLKAARFLAEQEPADVFEVAFHFQAAGAMEEGFDFARRAAALARDSHALTVAIFYLRAALAVNWPEAAELQRLWSELADCYRLTGHYEEALEALEQALRLSYDQQTRARLQLHVGDVHFKQGELEKAREAVLEGLRLLGEQPPRSVLLDFLWQGARQGLRSLLPARFFPTRPQEPGSTELLRADLYNRLAYTEWFLSGPLPSIRAHLRELNLAERFPPTRTLACARASHAIAMGALPLWDRALRFGASAVDMARQLGDDWAEGQACHFHGAALLGAARFQEAQEILEHARRRLGLTGDRWEENGARYHLGLVYLRQGELEKAETIARETHEIGVAINDRLAAGDNLFTWARASYGRVPGQLLLQEMAHSCPDIQRAAELLGAQALVALREGRTAEAERLLREALEIYRRRRASTPYSAPLHVWRASASRLLARQAGPGERRQAVRHARSSCRTALRVAKKYRENLPHALREQALLLWLTGQREAARRPLEESQKQAEQLGMKEELALGRAVQARWDGTEIQDDYGWLLDGVDGSGSPGPSLSA